MFADCTALLKKHPEYFNTAEDVRQHVETVLQQPDAIYPGNQADHRLLVFSDDVTHRAVALEIEFKGGKYRVRSAYILTQQQMERYKASYPAE